MYQQYEKNKQDIIWNSNLIITTNVIHNIGIFTFTLTDEQKVIQVI